MLCWDESLATSQFVIEYKNSCVSISDDQIRPRILKDKEPLFCHFVLSIGMSTVAKPVQAVCLWVLFRFTNHTLQRKNTLKSLLQIKGSTIIDHKNILLIYPSPRHSNYKGNIKPFLTLRLLARLFKLTSLQPIKTLPPLLNTEK